MSVHWIHNPLPGRHGHKRFDTDEPVAKCPRLSESSGDAGLLGSSPGSPVSGAPLSVSPTHQCPAHIGQFLLVPLTDRPGVHSALDMDTGEELVCKVNNFIFYFFQIWYVKDVLYETMFWYLVAYALFGAYEV